MSTLKATNLQHASSASPNIVLDSSGNATAAGTIAMASPFAMRNKIINGAMEISQRSAGVAVTVNDSANNVFTVDRWQGAGETSDGVFTLQRSSVAPAGFINSLLATVTTADASVGASQRYFIQQRVEGLNIADLGWGSASAKTVTLSFWVRSSLTGTFGGAVRNSAGDRSYPFTYSISAANTWEQKSITIPGDTTGTWLTTNGVGMMVTWGLGVGSTLSGTAGAWAATNYWSATGAVSVISTLSATFYLTGVQLEVGSVATPFERRLFAQELALCQRYYVKCYDTELPPANATGAGTLITISTSGGLAFVNWAFPVEMRSGPTVTLYNATTGATGTWRDGGGTDRAVTAAGIGTRQLYVFSTTVTANSTINGMAVAISEI